jgi:hypothetical protein
MGSVRSVSSPVPFVTMMMLLLMMVINFVLLHSIIIMPVITTEIT